jgi:hypothetical protein
VHRPQHSRQAAASAHPQAGSDRDRTPDPDPDLALARFFSLGPLLFAAAGRQLSWDQLVVALETQLEAGFWAPHSAKGC